MRFNLLLGASFATEALYAIYVYLLQLICWAARNQILKQDFKIWSTTIREGKYYRYWKSLKPAEDYNQVILFSSSIVFLW